jgi:hypothetical protein
MINPQKKPKKIVLISFVLAMLMVLACFITADVKPLSDEIAAFLPLASDRQLFNKVSVDGGGYGIVWNENIDLSSDELWYNGKKIG